MIVSGLLRNPLLKLVVSCMLLSSLAGAVTLDEVRSNVAAHRGRTIELTGRIAGTIVSDKGRTFMMDLGRMGYVFIREAPDSARVKNDMRVTIVARVPKEATNASEFEFVSAAAAKPEPVVEQTTTVTVAAGNDTITVQSSVVPIATSPPGAAKQGSQTTTPPSSSAIDQKVAELRPAYAKAIAYFNKKLPAAQRDRIADAVLRFSLANNLDPRLTVAVIAVESSFDPNSRSNHGAMGLGQLMPGTAAGMGVRNAYDPVENVNAAVRLIRGHLNNYSKRKDSFNVALAAYNAGSGAVRKHGGVPPYRETVNYIWKVYNLYKQLAPDMFK